MRSYLESQVSEWLQRDQLEEKFKLDVWYVDNQSLWLDIKILWLTVNEVLKRDGISAAGEATMHAFKEKFPAAN